MALRPSSQPSPVPAWGRLRLLLLVVAFGFAAAHAVALPHTLGDDDSVNFAMGVESFDVAAHRPHPPGYPVYIAAARVSTGALGLVFPSWDRDRRAAGGLAIWGVIAGAVAVLVIAELWLALGLTPILAALAAILCVASPLFWFTAGRPLSDTPGLVAAILVQVGFVRGLRLRSTGLRSVPASWLGAAFGAGILGGLRSQAVLLTAPFVVWCVVDLIVRGQRREAARLIGAGALGILVWAVPLVWMSGGLRGYWQLFASQGAEDLVGVEMLATNPSWSLLAETLELTFLAPWQADGFARVILVAALAGLVRLAWRAPGTLALLLLGYLPYVVFHLTLQETVTLRYALPIVVPVAGLAVVALGALGPRMASAGVAIGAAAGVLLAQPPLHAYAHGGAAVFPGFQVMHRALTEAPATPALHLHHQVWWGVRRAIEWYVPAWPGAVPPHPGDREWLGVVRHWAGGSDEPVWFLSALNRTDLELFDPRTTQFGGRFAMPERVHDLIGGARLVGFDWWRLEQPAWMLGRGWALTPEVAGVTAADGMAPHLQPAQAYLLRRPGAHRLMIGGRYVADADRPAAHIMVDLDGQAVADWTISADELWFVRWIDLPAGIPDGPGPYAQLTVRVVPAEHEQPPPGVALEQFDVARRDEPVVAFGADWHERESDQTTGRLWRWTSGRSTLDLRGVHRDAVLVLAGDSPRRDFDRAPTVVVRAGDRELARFTPADDFIERIAIPAGAFLDGEGRVTIDTDLTYSPAERGQSADQRRLGLKITRVAVTPR